MSYGCHGTWCRSRRAVTPCLSSRCYHDFSVSVSFTKSLKFWDCRSCTSLASGLSISRITAAHWYASRKSRTSPQRRAFLWRPLVVWCVRVSSCVGVSGPRLSRGFVSSSSRLRQLHVPGPRSVILWTCLSRARPSLRHAPRLPLLLSILQRRFRSTAGAVTVCLLSSLRVPTSGVHLCSVPVQSRPSVYLTDPFSSRNPAFRCQLRVLSGLPAS